MNPSHLSLHLQTAALIGIAQLPPVQQHFYADGSGARPTNQVFSTGCESSDAAARQHFSDWSFRYPVLSLGKGFHIFV
jgi:hypothetical protein